jgi:hypothetical protein
VKKTKRRKKHPSNGIVSPRICGEVNREVKSGRINEAIAMQNIHQCRLREIECNHADFVVVFIYEILFMVFSTLPVSFKIT